MIYLVVKRFLDISISIIGLVFLILLLPFVFILIKSLGGFGPLFYKARRVSMGKIFYIYKFRTMKNGASELKKDLSHLNERDDGPFFKISLDPRVTVAGKILRKFWIDELPQLYNVLKGEISLVGPRPYEPEEIEKYPKDYKFLKYEKAGITGLSQINGSSNLPFKKVLEYDSYYAKHKSLKLDLYILCRTFLLIFNPSGV
ncbi:MAG: hypothetical protein COV57_00730 [Candidatus Liptonbacteria bacterium CG11_big_fil_rev_8_21_14_0_20_35_14]|uniref:Bacterial sugar transferase domain-containing protein n=1 Tax=Candidatus Liptonbacteria bacterium CG11_big_fil_rev_8_21_14_0_20_35_14 TaxID=1974634 RepID=A0A2H0NAG9_9BACT|nr:MAG: hypothetical protein COV57_00730 [Candidatus Liptonbacteria bacterium CG11_big_fil_rev_8_21_14_0_20_35_14]